MQARVAALWRHPIKGVGVEAVEQTDLVAGATMPMDRVWAVAHDGARVDSGLAEWASCANFSRGARTGELMAVRAETNAAEGRITLTHPRLKPITVAPDDPADAARLVAWLIPISDPGRAQPAFVVRAPGRGMTDSDFPSIAILNRATLAELSGRIGAPLAMERFRGNVWLDGVDAWAEFDWIGREIRIGGATLRIRERITRCKATGVNPDTGFSDADTLAALQAGWGHQDFGVYAEVIVGGSVAVGDAAEVAPA